MPPMNDASERVFQDKVIQIAKMNGWLVFHPVPAQVRPGTWRSDGKGFPDLVLAHPDRGVIFAELKSATGKPSLEQLAWLRSTSPWCETYVWRPNDLDNIVKRLAAAFN